MENLSLLWVDRTLSLKEAELPVAFDKYFKPTVCRLDEDPRPIIGDRSPQVLCFDFDFPDRAGLELLLETKRSYPSIPILMLTLQHSEALSIWAFRSKVWDYLVKPVSRYEIDRCFHTLLVARRSRRNQRARVPAFHRHRLPAEISTRPIPHDEKLAPAVYYIEQFYRAKISVEDVARSCGMSPFRFSRAFKKAFGKTYRDYLVDHRLKEARRLLANPSVSVTDVSYAVGFNDPSYFARVFKQRLGVSPSLMIGLKEGSPQADRAGIGYPKL